MSFFQNPSFYFQTGETDIVNFFKKVEAGLEVLAQDFVNVVSWVQSDAGEIAAFVGGLIGVAVGASTGNIPAALLAAQSALTQGVSLLNSAVAAGNSAAASGGSALQQATAELAAAYSYFKQAQASAATVAATTTAPAASPAPATAS